MKFTKVIKASTGSERIMDGYRFVGIGESVGNLHSGDLDAFYDGWDGSIEQGEDGNLYLVQRLTFRAEDETPVIWCKVEREDESLRQPTNYEFVRNLFDATREHPEPLDLATAQQDLRNFRAEGWNVPDDLTAEEYLEIWNGLVSEYES